MFTVIEVCKCSFIFFPIRSLNSVSDSSVENVVVHRACLSPMWKKKTQAWSWDFEIKQLFHFDLKSVFFKEQAEPIYMIMKNFEMTFRTIFYIFLCKNWSSEVPRMFAHKF